MSSCLTKDEEHEETNKECYFVFIFDPKVMFVPLCDLISAETKDAKVVLLDKRWLKSECLYDRCIFTTSPKRGPSLFLLPGYPTKKMNRVDLGQLLHRPVDHYIDLCKLGRISWHQLHMPLVEQVPMKGTDCREMPVPTKCCLTVQVGEFVYVLSFVDEQTLAVQCYDIDNDNWEVYYDTSVRETLDDKSIEFYHFLSIDPPHVVIKHKIHVSFSDKYAFSFNTKKGTWECSNLFDRFPVCREVGNTWPKYYPTPALGFFGKGILVDDNKLLGINYSSKFQLVAYLLDDDDRVIQSQCFNFEAFKGRELEDAHLVDFGRDGYIGLTYSPMCRMELVTFKYSRPEPARDDKFLDLKLVQRYCLLKNTFEDFTHSGAFCF